MVKDKGSETLKKIDWDIGKNMAVKKALVDYVRRYIDRHGTIKVACVRMDYPVRLDKIYTAVQLLDRSALRYFESEDALQELSMSRISRTENQEFYSYFYILELMIRCKEEAVRVSPQVWEGIESRMVTVPD